MRKQTLTRTALIAATCLAWLMLPKTAFAARILHARIYLQDGGVVLTADAADNGKAGPDTVWRYLKTKFKFGGVLIQPDAKNPLRARARGRPSGGIQPDPKNPLRATLHGKILVTVDEGGGAAKVTKLTLVREDKSDHVWSIDADQVEKMVEHRTFFHTAVKHWVSETSEKNRDEARQRVWRELRQLTADEELPIDVYGENPWLNQLCFRSGGKTFVFARWASQGEQLREVQHKPVPVGTISRITFEYDADQESPMFVLWHDGKRKLTVPAGREDRIYR